MFGLKRKQLPTRTLDSIKPHCRICFIDDKKFEVIEILKRAGWLNTNRIKDVESLEQTDVKDAHILFVDVQGVGKKMGFADEGLGLIVALRNKYPHKKLIVYSAEEQQKITAFHQGMNLVNFRLKKDSDPYEFERLIEIYSLECFSADSCIDRITDIIRNDLGQSADKEKIKKALTKVYYGDSSDTEAIKKAFKVSNITAIVDIIKIFASIPS